jgi:glucose-6-phosphate isomerase
VSYWPSETGHDYRTIREQGFGARVRSVNGVPRLVPSDAGDEPSA